MTEDGKNSREFHKEVKQNDFRFNKKLEDKTDLLMMKSIMS